jgi:phosphoglycolate phosphatase
VTYDLVCFDLDGTLVDTSAEICEAANRTLESHGIGRRPITEITLLIGAGTRELMLRLLARCLLEHPTLARSIDPDAVLRSMEQHYAETAGGSARAYDGCQEMLSVLRAKGVKLACVTNKEVRHAQRVLEATGVAPLFDLVVGGDSLSEKKPHRSVLRHVVRTLGVPTTRTAHLGDSAIDVAAARNAGVAAWAVPYGYNAGRPIEESKPDRLFANLAEVAQHVLSVRRTGAAERRPT